MAYGRGKFSAATSRGTGGTWDIGARAATDYMTDAEQNAYLAAKAGDYDLNTEEGRRDKRIAAETFSRLRDVAATRAIGSAISRGGKASKASKATGGLLTSDAFGETSYGPRAWNARSDDDRTQLLQDFQTIRNRARRAQGEGGVGLSGYETREVTEQDRGRYRTDAPFSRGAGGGTWVNIGGEADWAKSQRDYEREGRRGRFGWNNRARPEWRPSQRRIGDFAPTRYNSHAGAALTEGYTVNAPGAYRGYSDDRLKQLIHPTLYRSVLDINDPEDYLSQMRGNQTGVAGIRFAPEAHYGSQFDPERAYTGLFDKTANVGIGADYQQNQLGSYTKRKGPFKKKKKIMDEFGSYTFAPLTGGTGQY